VSAVRSSREHRDDTAAGTATRPRTTAGQLLAWAAAAVTVVLWASAFVAIRHVGGDFSPGALTLGRLLVGSVLLGVVLVTRSPRWPSRAH
jgi:drug/metabolite transporter (DMT)-like permease